MENNNPNFELNEHISNIVFKKKETIEEPKTHTLEEQMVNYSNEVLGVKVISVALPPNYNPAPKTEEETIDWLQNKVRHRNTIAYRLSLKYGERLKTKLEQKEPYTNL
jgi:hypothetical protein